ncbi:MAG TPA: glycine cleavage system aminomethyltransferase GcvT [Thermoanaerobaculia bacterium]|nr:glycine cleavage system aminomethyltransferase GcvT [Thermoanaerobaculia bacterium]
MATSESLKRTPLYECHVEAGARLVDFAGWEMPVHYQGVNQGVIEEHRAVRTAAGIFDVSHMGEVRVQGPGAETFLQRLTPNDVSKLAPGRAHYSGLLTPQGTYVDDLLIYRIGAEEFLVVVNASNAERDFEWIASRADSGTQVTNESDRWALIALQGPKALEILRPLAPPEAMDLKYYGFLQGEVAGRPALISRTGYTGEDGFELYVAPEDAPAIWRRLLEAGALPAGLGARDTLRLEASMALYGHEIDESTTPFEAGLAWVVKMNKGDFLGREALAAQQAEGLRRKLIGFEVQGRGIARQWHEVKAEGQTVGAVTSGTWSPSFEKAVGMAYVPTGLAAPGTPLEVDVRGKALPAVVVEVPFYRRAKQ